MIKLADIYRIGSIVSQDYKKAFSLYEKAAKQNSLKSMFYLGLFYYNGFGVLKDNGKAKIWMKKAAQNGHERAKVFLETNKL